LIRCGAFCFSADRERAEAASKSARRIASGGTKLHVRDGRRARFGDGGWLVSLDYSGSDLPVVHGWIDAKSGKGECSALSQTRGGLEASRDYCGTRPLYLGGSKRWVASDHRFFPEEPRELLPRNAILSVSTGRLRVRRRVPGRFEGDFDDAAARLAPLIRDSVKARVVGKRRVAVAFSGGLDSSIVAHCAAQHCKVVACSVSTEGSTDSKVARDTASTMGVEFAGARADEKRLLREMRGLDLPFEPSPMDKSLWCIYSMTGRLAFESGADIVILGQLADELFGGYAKYQTALGSGGEAAAGRLMSDDIALCGVRGFIRDEAACRRWCEPRFPFADGELARFGEGLPVSFKIRDGVRKAVLRKAALVLGLPAEIAHRPKKAAQYSSGVMKLLG
jgi:asparagine synthase (glutamine-hydrolysing)